MEGRDEFIKTLGAGSPQIDTLLKNILTDDALKEMCDPTFKLMPDSPKKPGETWKRDSSTNLGPIGSYTVTYNFKYVGPAPEALRIPPGTSTAEASTVIREVPLPTWHDEPGSKLGLAQSLRATWQVARLGLGRRRRA